MIAPTSTPAPKPTPAALTTEWLVAVETTTTPHGPHTTTSTHRWDGYTAADLRAHWATRAKTAGWDYQWDGVALTVTMRDVGKTITRAFHDEEPT